MKASIDYYTLYLHQALTMITLWLVRSRDGTCGNVCRNHVTVQMSASGGKKSLPYASIAVVFDIGSNTPLPAEGFLKSPAG